MAASERDDPWAWLYRLFALDPSRNYEAERLAEAERQRLAYQSTSLRQDIANAIEQRERSAEKEPMAHPPPTNDPLLLERAYIEGWVLALTFGAEEELRAGHIVTGLVVLAVSIIGQIVVIRWPKIRARIAVRTPVFTDKFSHLVSDPRWWVVTLMVFMGYLALSPYVQQQRWPFSTVFHEPPTAEEMAKAIAPLQRQLDAANMIIADLREKISRLQPTSSASGNQPPISSSINWQTNLSAWMGGDKDGQAVHGICIRGTTSDFVDLKDAYVISDVTGEKITLHYR